MGALALKRMHPWAEPKTLAPAGGRRVPSFKVGVLGEDGRLVRRRAEPEGKFAGGQFNSRSWAGRSAVHSASTSSTVHRNARWLRLPGTDPLANRTDRLGCWSPSQHGSPGAHLRCFLVQRAGIVRRGDPARINSGATIKDGDAFGPVHPDSTIFRTTTPNNMPRFSV